MLHQASPLEPYHCRPLRTLQIPRRAGPPNPHRESTVHWRDDRSKPFREPPSTAGDGLRGVTVVPIRIRLVFIAIAANAMKASTIGALSFRLYIMVSKRKNPSQPAFSASAASCANVRAYEDSPKFGIYRPYLRLPIPAPPGRIYAVRGSASTVLEAGMIEFKIRRGSAFPSTKQTS